MSTYSGSLSLLQCDYLIQVCRWLSIASCIAPVFFNWIVRLRLALCCREQLLVWTGILNSVQLFYKCKIVVLLREITVMAARPTVMWRAILFFELVDFHWFIAKDIGLTAEWLTVLQSRLLLKLLITVNHLKFHAFLKEKILTE
jgi:hypothetical protein